MTIGQRIKEQRKKLKLTQEELAKQINVSSQVISNWEREYTKPDFNDLHWLSISLEVSADYLLTGDELVIQHEMNNELTSWIEFGNSLIEKGYLLNEIESLINQMIKTLKF